ncbi:glycosyltransferase [Mucilaginibacter ginkgonis]|uniref:Glycosyltransferase n=1 Tax=Mucilaginibacter ginkgonis TaxID=2682091 RepID=A0A6I4I6H5_9SPHI|nr:glycosyltransferase [Mucilaginibacter ginkgonis]QQL50884.1 glycosyltransferase [Mucilaginibacter ginkgonis]
MTYTFDTITLLVTHYNRSKSLERLLKSFVDRNITFGDVVVSDDGSNEEHLSYMRAMQEVYKFRLITTPQNRGLGNNINKGQDAVTTPLTIYVQEDFEPVKDFGKHLADALTIINERPDVDIIRFYAYFLYPFLKPYKFGFSEMIFKIWLPGYRKFHVYSDHPHLRRSNFFEKFGRYAEGLKGDKTEFLMSMSFTKHKGKAMFYEDFKGLFEQINTDAEPSTMTLTRSNFRQSNNPFIAFGRAIYRNVKHTYDYLTFKRRS